MSDFNQADFDRFRADPKRQALVKRILADEELTVTGHVVGATYRSRYWGGAYNGRRALDSFARSSIRKTGGWHEY